MVGGSDWDRRMAMAGVVAVRRQSTPAVGRIKSGERLKVNE